MYGKGNLYAEKLTAKSAKVTCRRKGNAKINAATITDAIKSGNGNITNTNH